jgi:hypothetical protein
LALALLGLLSLAKRLRPRAATSGEREYFRGVRVVRGPGRGGVCLGEYIFVSVQAGERLLRHEYGHTRQSRRLGWLYLVVVGLPSVSMAAYSRVAARLGRPGPARRYYDRFPENWADRLGGVQRRRVQRRRVQRRGVQRRRTNPRRPKPPRRANRPRR